MKERAINLLASVGLVLYPVAIYLGMRHESLRWASLVVVLLVSPAIYLRLRNQSLKELSTFAWIPLLTVGMITTGALLNKSGVVLAAPVVVNIVLLAGFGATIWTDASMIERFARLQVPHLTDEKCRWCRTWTIIWCGFFIANGTTAALLAVYAPLEWWTLYNSLISYVLIGVLFAIERTARWFRFEKNTTAT